MSLEKVHYVLNNLDSSQEWQIKLLRITTTKNAGTIYATRNIVLDPPGTLLDVITGIKCHYLEGSNAKYSCFREVRDYDGTAEASAIYKISTDHELVCATYTQLTRSLSHGENEGDPFDFRANAYVLYGSIKIPGQLLINKCEQEQECTVILITMQNPVSVLKHKFLYDAGTFKKISDKVLSIRPYFDVLIIDGTVYMLTMAGEKVFSMDRAYRAICDAKVTAIEGAKIVTLPERFRDVATKGHNPRRFAGFSQEYFNRLQQNIDERQTIARRFGIPMQGDQFNVESEDAANKLIKLLCRKGMRDAFDDIAVEVDSARPWN